MNSKKRPNVILILTDDQGYWSLGGSGTYHNAEAYRGTERIRTRGYLTDVLTDDALSFIDECCHKPFYLNLTYTAPHSPHVDQHPEEYVRYYQEHCTFSDVPQDPRSPWSIQMPHDIAYSLTFANKDREYPTLRDLLSGYYAAVQAVDDNVGRIVKKLEEKGILDNTLLVFTADNGFSCGYQDYHESVVVFDEYGPNRMIRTKDWKYIHRYPEGPDELYDLKHDPAERFNLLTENRFFNYGPKLIEEKARELRAQLFDWFRAYVDPDQDGALEPVAGRGQLCKVGPEANGRNPFHPAVAVEYHR